MFAYRELLKAFEATLLLVAMALSCKSFACFTPELGLIFTARPKTV